MKIFLGNNIVNKEDIYDPIDKFVVYEFMGTNLTVSNIQNTMDKFIKSSVFLTYNISIISDKLMECIYRNTNSMSEKRITFLSNENNIITKIHISNWNFGFGIIDNNRTLYKLGDDINE
jgi:hypothetical protein